MSFSWFNILLLLHKMLLLGEMGEGYIGPLYSETNCQSNYFIIKFVFKKGKIISHMDSTTFYTVIFLCVF